MAANIRTMSAARPAKRPPARAWPQLIGAPPASAPAAAAIGWCNGSHATHCQTIPEGPRLHLRCRGLHRRAGGRALLRRRTPLCRIGGGAAGWWLGLRLAPHLDRADDFL